MIIKACGKGATTVGTQILPAKGTYFWFPCGMIINAGVFTSSVFVVVCLLILESCMFMAGQQSSFCETKYFTGNK